MIEDLVSALKKSSLFKNLSDKQIEQVITHLQPRLIILKNGEHLYHRGDPADCCWEVLSGHFLLQRGSLRHPFQPLDYHIGAVTGLLGLVEPGAERPVSLIADSEVELIEIRGDALSQLDESTRVIIWENIAHILIRKLFHCRSQLATMGE
ncbi:MAG: cyclic nucleotide-binding domain-containing protein [Gammaproteobacteria bacterium]|nr:cyclic nucleotide-binding domain-containing protein [Gammaproteobacteria bacterium]